MKNYLLLTLISLLLLGCKSYVQVFNTNSSIQTAKNGVYVYETDSVKITYSFWKEKGLMSFSIFNKLKKPLYVDWKKSSYVDNSVKLDYWVDEEKSKQISSYGSYFYDGPLLTPLVAIRSTIGASLKTTVKIERLTFIPPSSIYSRSQFYIYPVNFYKLGLDRDFEEFTRKDNPKKTTKVYKAVFTKENSPLVFRNFLTFSTTEGFETEFYVDNEFFLEEILEMDRRYFEQSRIDETKKGKELVRDDNGRIIQFSDFKQPSSFYLRIPKGGSIESRK